MDLFSGKTAIVTGGASGIGKSLAAALLKRGAVVVIADRNGDLLDKTVAELSNLGPIKAIKLDVTDPVAVKKVVNDVVAEHGKLDYIFNNAGIGVGGEARDYEYEDWKKVVDVDLFGVINGVYAAYPIMVKQGFGHIVNTASVAGLAPFPGEISYVTAKYGVVGLSETLRIEGADLGVKVSVVCPGMIRTPIYENSKIIGINLKDAMAHFPKGITPDQCATIIIKGVEKNKRHIVVTGLAKVLWIAHRISPCLVEWIGKRFIRDFRKLRKI